LRTGESQAGLRRTLRLIEEMHSTFCFSLDYIVLLRPILHNSVSLVL
jgi:hypothetical protein